MTRRLTRFLLCKDLPRRTPFRLFPRFLLFSGMVIFFRQPLDSNSKCFRSRHYVRITYKAKMRSMGSLWYCTHVMLQMPYMPNRTMWSPEYFELLHYYAREKHIMLRTKNTHTSVAALSHRCEATVVARHRDCKLQTTGQRR